MQRDLSAPMAKTDSPSTSSRGLHHGPIKADSVRVVRVRVIVIESHGLRFLKYE